MDAASRERVVGEIEFETFSADDLEGISQLITAMSGDGRDLHLRDKSPAYYRWMYFANPAGAAMGCLARHGDRIVSSFAVAPKVMQVDGRRRLMGKTMDMFTDPEYQGMGLIKKCCDRAFAMARQAGVDGWYVTPSPNSYPIFKNKWGYSEDFELVYRTRMLDVPAVAAAMRPALGRVAGPLGRVKRRAAGPTRLPAGWTVAELAAFDAEADALWAEVGEGYGVAIVRDAAYLNWRYVENPDHYAVYGLRRDGLLRGIVVLKTTTRHGIPVGEIVDIVAPAQDARIHRLLLRIAVDHSRRLGCALVEAWSIRGTWLDRRLVLSGLAIPRAKIPFLLSPDHPDPLVHDKHAWLLTQGDGNDV